MIRILYIDPHVEDSKILKENIEIAAKAKRFDVEVMTYGDLTSIGYVSNVDIVCIAPRIRDLQKSMDLCVSDETPVMVIDYVSYKKKVGHTIIDDVLGILKNKRGETTWKNLQHGWKNTSSLSLQKLVHKSI